MDFLNTLGPALTFTGAALAVILPGIGSAKAVGRVGQAASGVLAEDPEKYGKLLILQALPGTQGIYGLLSWFLIMYLSGLFGGATGISFIKGVMYFMAAMPITFVGYASALHQGRVAETGVALVAKRPEEQAKALILAAMVETYAILALLATVLGTFRIAIMTI